MTANCPSSIIWAALKRSQWPAREGLGKKDSSSPMMGCSALFLVSTTLFQGTIISHLDPGSGLIPEGCTVILSFRKPLISSFFSEDKYGTSQNYTPHMRLPFLPFLPSSLWIQWGPCICCSFLLTQPIPI